MRYLFTFLSIFLFCNSSYGDIDTDIKVRLKMALVMQELTNKNKKAECCPCNCGCCEGKTCKCGESCPCKCGCSKTGVCNCCCKKEVMSWKDICNKSLNENRPILVWVNSQVVEGIKGVINYTAKEYAGVNNGLVILWPENGTMWRYYYAGTLSKYCIESFLYPPMTSYNVSSSQYYTVPSPTFFNFGGNRNFSGSRNCSGGG